jgi:hypothetical protein
MLLVPGMPFWQALKIQGTAPSTLSARNSRRFIFRDELALVAVIFCTNNALYFSALWNRS